MVRSHLPPGALYVYMTKSVKSSLLLLFFTCLALVNLVKSEPAINRIIQIYDDLEQNEYLFDHITTVLNRISQGEPEIDIFSVIKSDRDFFFALKSAIEFKSKKTIQALLKRRNPFNYRDIDVDLFILLAIPRLNWADPKSITTMFFGSNLRAVRKEASADSKTIGTFKFESLCAYTAYLERHPHEISRAYELFHGYLKRPILFIFSSVQIKLIELLDLISGKSAFFESDEIDLELLIRLSEYNLDQVMDDQVIMGRLTSVFERYFVASNLPNKFRNLLYWNLNSILVKRAFRSVYATSAETLENAVFEIIVEAIDANLPVLPNEFNTDSKRSSISAVFYLIPYDYSETLTGCTLTHNLILRLLSLAVEEARKERKEDSVKPLRRLQKIPPVISEMIDVLGIAFDIWPQPSDLLRFPKLFDADGFLHWQAIWILGQRECLMSAISPEMLSSAKFERLIADYFQIGHRDVTDRILGLFDVKAEFRKLLKNMMGKILIIEYFLRIFRIESDFKLISKLPSEEQSLRYTRLDFVQLEESDIAYIYASIYARETKSDNENEEEEFRATLVAKIILAIL